MLRVYGVQLFYILSDPAMEDLLYEVESVRRFTGVRLEKVPDETTILNFRRRLELYELGCGLFDEIHGYLAEQGLSLREGSVVDATIISATPSTKNKQGNRYPGKHQAKKGNQWFFGMKLHIGTDDVLGLVQSLEARAANVHDLTPAPKLLHGEENRAWIDAGYQAIQSRPEHAHREVEWHVAMRPGRRKQLAPNEPDATIERCKSRIPEKVEHPFRLLKRVFGYEKVRYRGLQNNVQRLALLTGFANSMTAEPCLP